MSSLRSDFYQEMLSAPVEGSQTHRSWVVPDQWQQGRGAFGGLVVGAMVRAMDASIEAPEAQPLRSISATLCGPVMPGDAKINTEILRLGSGTSTVVTKIVQEDGLKAHATAIFGKDRMVGAAGDWGPDHAPQIPDWRALDTLPVGPPIGPVFAQHFEYRALGPMPFSGGREFSAQGFIRPKVPGERRDAAFLAGLVDCWWPVAFSVLQMPRPMATIAYTTQFLDPWGDLDPDSPLYYRAKSSVSRVGYGVEFRELWSPDGRLLAMNQQTIAMIK